MNPARFSAQATEAISRVLNASNAAHTAASKGPSGNGDFVGAMKQALASVNQSQKEASTLAQQFQLHEPDVSLEATMIAAQKANISFQALLQVRNKLVSAYHEIMNMQV